MTRLTAFTKWETLMFGWWGRTVVRTRWWVLAAGLVLAIVGGLWGTGVFGALVSDGFNDPHAESSRAADRIVAEIGRQDVDLLVLYSSTGATVTDASFRDGVTAAAARLRARPEVANVVSF